MCAWACVHASVCMCVYESERCGKLMCGHVFLQVPKPMGQHTEVRN